MLPHFCTVVDSIRIRYLFGVFARMCVRVFFVWNKWMKWNTADGSAQVDGRKTRISSSHARMTSDLIYVLDFRFSFGFHFRLKTSTCSENMRGCHTNRIIRRIFLFLIFEYPFPVDRFVFRLRVATCQRNKNCLLKTKISVGVAVLRKSTRWNKTQTRFQFICFGAFPPDWRVRSTGVSKVRVWRGVTRQHEKNG